MIYSVRNLIWLAIAAALTGLVSGAFGAASTFNLEAVIIGLALLAGAPFLPNKKGAVWLAVLGVFLLCLAIGQNKGVDFQKRIEDLRQANEELFFEGEVSEIASAVGGRQRFYLEDKRTKLKYFIEATSPGPINAGDQASGQGSAKAISQSDDFDYAYYLATHGVSRFIGAKSITIKESRGDSLRAVMGEIKEGIIERLAKVLPPLESQLVGGMVLGSGGITDKTLLKQMNRTGTRHIVAVSGFNIALVGFLALGALLLLGLARSWASGLAIILIVLYVILTGLSPSAVRAGIMGVLSIYALSRGLKHGTLSLLMIAALAMLVENPFLISDVSFQLSFGAVLGLLTFYPLFADFLPKSLPRVFREVFAASLAVQILVAPIGIFHFGTLALGSLIFNIIIVPLVPLVTVLGLLAGLLPLIGEALAPPLYILSHFIIAFISSGAPLSPILELRPGSWAVLIILYLLIISLYFTLEYFQRKKHARLV